MPANAAKSYAEVFDEADRLVKDIDFLMSKHQDYAGRDPYDWRYVGDMTHVVEALSQVKEFLSGYKKK